MRTTALLETLEAYYDAAPRPIAATEQDGPFTLFVPSDPRGWHFYARPMLGLDTPVTAADVRAVRRRQRERRVPEQLEWVHETTPSLLPAAQAAGLATHACPLLVLPDHVAPAAADGPGNGNATSNGTVRVLTVEDPQVDEVPAVVEAAFAGRDHAASPSISHSTRLLQQEGLLVLAAAFDEHGDLVGGGSHQPRGATTEVSGIGVLPRVRRRGLGAALAATLAEDARSRGVRTIFLSAQDDAVARIYQRVGFNRVGTAYVAEATDG